MIHNVNIPVVLPDESHPSMLLISCLLYTKYSSAAIVRDGINGTGIIHFPDFNESSTFLSCGFSFPEIQKKAKSMTRNNKV